MYSDLMKYTMKMYYTGIYIFVYTVCINLMSDMKLMNSFNKIPTNVILSFVSKVHMIIQVINLHKCFSSKGLLAMNKSTLVIRVNMPSVLTS